MNAGLLLTAFVMGLAGGPHCLAMCGAACAALAGATRVAEVRNGPGRVIPIQVSDPTPTKPSGQGTSALLGFQLGRLAAYACAGALAAWTVDGLAALTTYSVVFRPVWGLMHAAMLAWGVMLMVLARQPAWVDGMGQGIWRRVSRAVGSRRAPMLMGLGWALLPCGLLYSALLVAALSGGPGTGALCMALFALGSAISLVLGAWAWLRLQSASTPGLARWRGPRYQAWGIRLAGGVLAAAAAWALVHDLDPRVTDYCRSLFFGG